MLRTNQAKTRFIGQSLLLAIPAAAFSLAGTFLSSLGGKLFSPFGHSPARSIPLNPSPAESPATTVQLYPQTPVFVDSYLEKESHFLQEMKGKSSPWFRAIEKVLRHQNLPLQLKYLAIVESELQPGAQSAAGARGLWQLMPNTAKDLGLRIDSATDERLHAHRSTLAAAQYLKNLYSKFGDWLLVVAAYNSGPGSVLSAMKKAGSRNYWALERHLPAESRIHVKRFIGIHYFFEGRGSAATQTRAATLARL